MEKDPNGNEERGPRERVRGEGPGGRGHAGEVKPFHLDEDAARDTIFGGLAARGWHTAAVTMRLLVESDLKPAGGIVGTGADEFRWLRPVRPGDQLRIESEVLEVRPSRSRKDLPVFARHTRQRGRGIRGDRRLDESEVRADEMSGRYTARVITVAPPCPAIG